MGHERIAGHKSWLSSMGDSTVSRKRRRGHAEETRDLVDRLSRKQDRLPEVVSGHINDFIGDNHLGTVAELHTLQDQIILQEWRAFFADVIKPSSLNTQCSVEVRAKIAGHTDEYPLQPEWKFEHGFLRRSETTVIAIAKKQGFQASFFHVSVYHDVDEEDYCTPTWHFQWPRDAFDQRLLQQRSAALAQALAARVAHADDTRFKQYIEEVLVPAADAGCLNFEQSAEAAVQTYFRFPEDTTFQDAVKRILAAAERHGICCFATPIGKTEAVYFSWECEFFKAIREKRE